MTRQSRVKGWVEVPAARAHWACARALHPSRRLLEPGGGARVKGSTAGGLVREAEGAARDRGHWIRGPGQQEGSWPGTSRGEYTV